MHQMSSPQRLWILPRESILPLRFSPRPGASRCSWSRQIRCVLACVVAALRVTLEVILRADMGATSLPRLMM